VAGTGRDVAAVGDRVESLLAELRSLTDPAVTDRVEEVVRLLVEFYGATVERMLELLAEEDGGQARIERLAEDPLVASVLMLHDLHPVSTADRVQEALEQVRPYLGSHAGGVEFLGIDGDGVARLRLEGSCSGCASSTVTVKLAIEQAINDAAPELAGIEVEGVVAEPAPQLLQIRPLHREPPHGEPEPEVAAVEWADLPPVAAAEGRLLAVVSGDSRLLLCRAGGSLLAYADACAVCGSGLTGGSLDGTRLTCPGCGAAWDVRLAGRSLDGRDEHLDPLPLMGEGERLRVALPVAAGSGAQGRSGR
jgi:Fe-S cluster biogenesis protein NfuA/nitrite reductase/ring-hydroxylating ferredoxin subunit